MKNSLRTVLKKSEFHDLTQTHGIQNLLAFSEPKKSMDLYLLKTALRGAPEHVTFLRKKIRDEIYAPLGEYLENGDEEKLQQIKEQIKNMIEIVPELGTISGSSDVKNHNIILNGATDVQVSPDVINQLVINYAGGHQEVLDTSACAQDILYSLENILENDSENKIDIAELIGFIGKIHAPRYNPSTGDETIKYNTSIDYEKLKNFLAKTSEPEVE